MSCHCPIPIFSHFPTCSIFLPAFYIVLSWFWGKCHFPHGKLSENGETAPTFHTTYPKIFAQLQWSMPETKRWRVFAKRKRYSLKPKKTNKNPIPFHHTGWLTKDTPRWVISQSIVANGSLPPRVFFSTAHMESELFSKSATLQNPLVPRRDLFSRWCSHVVYIYIYTSIDSNKSAGSLIFWGP